MAFRIIITLEAANDLQSIHDYISQDSTENANQVASRILHSIDLLELFPYRTIVQRPRGKKGPTIRTVPIPPYIVYFRLAEESQTVIVLRIQHGARQTPRFD